MKNAFEIFNREMANYNQINDDNIAQLKSFIEKVNVDLKSVQSDIYELKATTDNKLVAINSLMTSYAEDAHSL